MNNNKKDERNIRSPVLYSFPIPLRRFLNRDGTFRMKNQFHYKVFPVGCVMLFPYLHIKVFTEQLPYAVR